MTDRPTEGYTRIPNDTLEAIMRLPGAACQVTLFVLRKTNGWQKTCDEISISQFVDATGLSRQGVVNGIEGAIAAGRLRREPSGHNNGFCYQVVNKVDGLIEQVVNEIDYPTPASSQQSRPQAVNKVDGLEPQVVNKVDTQKKDSKGKKERGSRSSRKRAAAPGEKPTTDPTPAPIRQAFAQACDVDIGPGAKPPRAQITALNQECKLLWEQQETRGVPIDATVNGIFATVKYIRATDRRFKDSASRIPLGMIRENWTAAARWLGKQQAPYVNGTNGHHPTGPPERRPTPEETARAAAKFDPFGDT